MGKSAWGSASGHPITTVAVPLSYSGSPPTVNVVSS